MTAIEDYLAEVRRRLPRGRLTRADVLDELRDGLIEAVESRDDADSRPTKDYLVREFGEPRAVGDEFSSEIPTGLLRRSIFVVLMLLVTGQIGWFLAESAIGVPVSIVPTGLSGTVFMSAVVLLQGSVIAAGAAASLTVLSTSLPFALVRNPRIHRVLACVTTLALVLFILSAVLLILLAAPRGTDGNWRQVVSPFSPWE